MNEWLERQFGASFILIFLPRHGPFTATNVKPVICHFSLSSHICGETFEPKQLTDYWFIVLLLVSFNTNTQVDDSTHHHKYACVMLLATRWNKQHKPQPQHSLTTTDAVGWFCFAHYSLYDQKLWVVLTSMMNISAFLFQQRNFIRSAFAKYSFMYNSIRIERNYDVLSCHTENKN